MKQSTKIHVGLRLLFAVLFMAIGNFAMAGAALLFPVAQAWSPTLGITAEEEAQKNLLDTIQKTVKSIVEDSQKENVKKADLDKRIEELNKTVGGLSETALKELKSRMDELAKTNETLQSELSTAKENLNTQGAELKKLKDNANDSTKRSAAPLSFRQAVKEAILEHKDILTEKNDDYGKRLSMKSFFEKGGRRTPELTVKVAVDMLQSNIVGNYVNNIRLTELDPNRVGIPLTIYPHVMDVFKVKQISRPFMSLLVVYSYEDGAATKTEGSASSKSSFLFKTVEFKAFFIATYFTLSDETLDDLEEALDEISTVAPDKILDKIDTYILGDAGDDASAIAGILTTNKHTDFSNPFSQTIEAAYIVDVIEAAKLQCKNNKYKPNVVYMSPEDVAALGTAKNTLEDSKLDRRVAYNNIGIPTFICGLRVIESTEIAEGELIVLDNNLPWIGRRNDMTMEIGYNGTDLTEGQKTVVLKTRVAFGVRDKAGVIYVDSVTDAIAALQAT